HYSFADLQRDGTTVWDGVSNALARQHLRKIKRGDRVLMYHTGKEKAVVGVMRVVSGPQADPTDADPKPVAREGAPVRWFERPVPPATIKADPRFKGWELVRLPRLSVMPVTEEQWQRIEELSETETK